eukprot:TRINITY_DN9802_c0_g2_i1.p2 TRINITY_DN9802_c0_g2~~TRINITY_DN9802_c0_g2_i1.p2  ORF type:complete len:273 (+),score=93.01 TRINITY_DN9802_c0_g2_i1:509-1327(+)
MTRMPCVYINHGGGPLPLLGRQPEVAEFLSGYLATLPARPAAIVVATAHWETEVTTVGNGAAPGLVYDYGGFPREAYEYKYPAPGSPSVARKLVALLAAHGLACEADEARGWDHGVFVPMMLMAKDADIPVVALSLLKAQDGAEMAKVGAALGMLRDQGILFVGSGAGFHNFASMFAPEGSPERADGEAASAAFDAWLTETFTKVPSEERARRIENNAWATAPGGRAAHPAGAAEHLMPLFFIAGVAGPAAAARKVGPCPTTGFRMAQFEFQ